MVKNDQTPFCHADPAKHDIQEARAETVPNMNDGSVMVIYRCALAGFVSSRCISKSNRTRESCMLIGLAS